MCFSIQYYGSVWYWSMQVTQCEGVSVIRQQWRIREWNVVWQLS